MRNRLLTPEQIARRKRTQQNLTTTAATLGLAAVGAKTGSAGLKALKKAPQVATGLSHATNVMGTTAGGLGSIAALSYSDLKHNVTTKKKPMIKSAFGIEHVEKKFVSVKRRKKLKGKKQTFRGSSYPIGDQTDLAAAKHAFGRSKPGDRAALRAFINRRAKALGGTPMGVNKAFDPEAKRHRRTKAEIGGLGTVSAGLGSGAFYKLGRKERVGQGHINVTSNVDTLRNRPQLMSSRTTTDFTPKFKRIRPPRAGNPKQAAALAAGSVAAAGGAALLARHARHGGKTYTNNYRS